MIGVGVAMISGGIPVSIVYALVTGFFFKPRGEGAVIIKTKESS
jgi:hypothetical protein